MRTIAIALCVVLAVGASALAERVTDPPWVADPTDPQWEGGSPTSQTWEFKTLLDDPLAPFEGRGKARLQALSPETGKQIAQYTLDAPPVFDGLIAAGGRVYVSLANGAVECW